MEYYGCSDLAHFNLAVSGRLNLPLNHEKNATAIGLCCESGKPGVPFGKTARETLDNLIGLRTRLILRGGWHPIKIHPAQNVAIT